MSILIEHIIWAYLWVITMLWIKHIILQALVGVYHCKKISELRRLLWGFCIRTKLSQKTMCCYSAEILLGRMWHNSKGRSRWVDVTDSSINGWYDTKNHSIRHLVIIRSDTGVSFKALTCILIINIDVFDSIWPRRIKWWSYQL